MSASLYIEIIRLGCQTTAEIQKKSLTTDKVAHGSWQTYTYTHTQLIQT